MDKIDELNPSPETAPSQELKALLNPANLLKMAFKLFWLSITQFLMRLFVLFGFSVLVAVGVYFMLSEDDSWRGPIAGGIALAVNTIVAVVVAFQTAIVATMIRAVESLGLGRMIFDYMFADVLGNDVDSPDEARSISQSFDGLTADELREKMTTSATGMLDNLGVGQRIPMPVRWVSKKVFDVATWGVVKVVMSYASVKSEDGSNRLSMDFIRNDLGAKIDKDLADSARKDVNNNVRFIFGGTMLATLAVAGVIAMI